MVEGAGRSSGVCRCASVHRERTIAPSPGQSSMPW